MRIRFLFLLYLLTCGLPTPVTMGAERHTFSKPSNARRDKHRPATKKAPKATKRPEKGVRPKQDRKAKRQKIVVRRRVIKIVSKKGKTANRIPAKRLTRSRSLRGTVYYLASGHGGPDPGAIGRYGRFRLAEDEYAYDVTIRLSQLLKQQGATVYMMVRDPNDGIRNDAVLKLDNDEVSYSGQRIPLNQLARLNQTTSAVNRLYAKHKGAYQRLVTIHVDSRSRGEMIDVFFYHHENSAVGKRLANRIHRRFLANYRRYRPSRPYVGNVSTRSELYVVRKSLAPTVFIELGNIQNRQDQKRFLLASNRQALASWLAEGLMDDYRDQ